ncbi:MAG: GGDEF domain-containing protein [Pseudobdellovibrionaceae bacterium]|jgi:diguanylate cyclase (GGDEF)-like protein|nr:GGDEF domain-containing protein [Pseudobdellovibrionaceae bacterium]
MPEYVTTDTLIKSLRDELIQAKESAKYWEVMATTDDLTGLHNRRMLNHVHHHITERRSERHGDITLLFIDLDDFGQLNKIYGDDVGDDALRLLGQMIRKNIRSTDIAIRKGGDEFILFLMDTTPELASGAVVKRLQLMLDGELFLNVQNKTIPIKGSIGVFSYNKNLSPLDNMRHADTLMRQTKKSRKKGIKNNKGKNSPTARQDDRPAAQ